MSNQHYQRFVNVSTTSTQNSYNNHNQLSPSIDPEPAPPSYYPNIDNNNNYDVNTDNNYGNNNNHNHPNDPSRVIIDINNNNNNAQQPTNNNNNEQHQVTLQFRTLTGQLLTMKVDDLQHKTVLDIKNGMSDVHHIPSDFQRYIFAGKELLDDELIVTYGVNDKSIIHILLRQNQTQQQNNNNQQQAQGQATYATNNIQNMPVAPIAEPVPMPQQVNNTEVPYSVFYQLAFNYGRLVKMFALVDLFAMVIYAFYFWPFAVGIPLCLCGYVGVQKMRNTFVYLYMLWLIVMIALFILFIVANFSAVVAIFLGVSIAIQFWILYMIYRYIQYVNMLSNEQFNLLYYTLNPNAGPRQSQQQNNNNNNNNQ